MQGIIDAYSPDHGIGRITVETREGFVFDLADWRAEYPPRTGAVVKFDPDRSMARLVVPLEFLN